MAETGRRSYTRYDSPECPDKKELPDHSWERMVRLYRRNPENRQFEAVGWYCVQCQKALSDKEIKPARE